MNEGKTKNRKGHLDAILYGVVLIIAMLGLILADILDRREGVSQAPTPSPEILDPESSLATQPSYNFLDGIKGVRINSAMSTVELVVMENTTPWMSDSDGKIYYSDKKSWKPWRLLFLPTIDCALRMYSRKEGRLVKGEDGVVRIEFGNETEDMEGKNDED